MGISESISFRLAQWKARFIYFGNLSKKYAKVKWFENYGKDKCTSMCVWYPLVKDVLPMPETVILEINKKETYLIAIGMCPKELNDRIKKTAKGIGYPLFIRTDLTSHKKDWKNNRVKDEASLMKKVRKLIRYNLTRPHRNLQAIVLRKEIPLYSWFKTSTGRPVTIERRYFVRDGKVLCHSGHWLYYNGGPHQYIIPPEDYSKISDINTETADEIEFLTIMAEAFSKRIDCHMSVDFAMDQNGEWFLIEANHATSSWHPYKWCEHHPLWCEQKTG